MARPRYCRADDGEFDGSLRALPHRVASRWIVDDFGNRRRVRRCGRCRAWQEEGYESFSPRKRTPEGRVTRWDDQCRPCRLKTQREEYAAADPEARRRATRAKYERVRADDEKMERRRVRHRAEAARWRREHPEDAARIHREWAERVNGNPRLLAARRESQRMARRLREDAAGRALEPLPAAPRTKRESTLFPELLAAPLARALARHIACVEAGNLWDELPGGPDDTGSSMAPVVLARCGVAPHTYWEWRNDRNPNSRVMFDTADGVLVAIGLHWWDVWTVEAVGEWEAALAQFAFTGESETVRRARLDRRNALKRAQREREAGQLEAAA